MPVSTIANISLEFEITFEGAPITFECQVITADLSLPGPAQSGSATETACPDGKVSEPGQAQNGSITGEIFVDSTDAGITWALATLFQADTEFPYSITYWANEPSTVAITFSGNAKVNSFTLPFSKPGYAKQPLDLALVTAVMARPVAA